MHRFRELDLGARLVVFEETASAGLIVLEQRAEAVVADLATLDLLHPGAHDGDFQGAVSRKHLVTEPVETLIPCQVMKAVAKLVRKPFSNRLQLLAQIV